MGIRNNNPGNLRGYPNTDYNLGYRAGFAVFKNPDDGLKALFSEIWMTYKNHGRITPVDFAGRYAPPSENDTLRYASLICTKLNVSPLKMKTYDLKLTNRWQAFDMCRAIVAIENGYAPSAYASSPDWYTPTDYADAQTAAGCWEPKA